MNEAENGIHPEGTKIKLTEAEAVSFWSKVNKNGPQPDPLNPHYELLDRCWVWTGATARHGYGSFGFRGKTRTASRLSWMIEHGAISSREFVLHRCDNPSCVNPSHLFLGNQKDNMHDASAKKRTAIGRRNGSCTHPSGPRKQEWIDKQSGDHHWSRKHPEKARLAGLRLANYPRATGDEHWARKQPNLVKRGGAHYRSKFTEDQIRSIRAEHAAGNTNYRKLGEKYSTDFTNIAAIVTRKNWKHVI